MELQGASIGRGNQADCLHFARTIELKFQPLLGINLQNPVLILGGQILQETVWGNHLLGEPSHGAVDSVE